MRSGLITHAEKVLFPERGETKGDLAEHYLRVAEPLMRATAGIRRLQPDTAGVSDALVGLSRYLVTQIILAARNRGKL